LTTLYNLGEHRLGMTILRAALYYQESLYSEWEGKIVEEVFDKGHLKFKVA
jgi:hypothetical protein